MNALSAADGDDCRLVEFDQAADRRRAARRNDLRAVLARLDNGGFSWCEACGELIGEKRLDIDPAAACCVECASA